MDLFIEIFYITIINNEILYHQDLIDITNKNMNPDDIVYNQIENTFGYKFDYISENFIIHSTSWRYDNTGKLILTYLAYNDNLDVSKINFKIFYLDNFKIAVSKQASIPKPPEIHEINIISHGLRHISYLLSNEHSDLYGKLISKDNLTILKSIDEDLGGKFE